MIRSGCSRRRDLEIVTSSVFHHGKSPCLHLPISALCVRMCSIVPTFCDPMDSSVRGIFKARILEWVTISYSEDLLNSGVKPMSHLSPALEDGFFITALAGKPHLCIILLSNSGNRDSTVLIFISQNLAQCLIHQLELMKCLLIQIKL